MALFFYFFTGFSNRDAQLLLVYGTTDLRNVGKTGSIERT
jgi:hypothetical protein